MERWSIDELKLIALIADTPGFAALTDRIEARARWHNDITMMSGDPFHDGQLCGIVRGIEEIRNDIDDALKKIAELENKDNA